MMLEHHERQAVGRQMRREWKQIERDSNAGRDLLNTLKNAPDYSRFHILKTLVLARHWVERHPGESPELEALLKTRAI